MAKVIYHIDLNSFFASAEEVLDPAIKDKPVVVSGNSRRGVVTTANYIAREYGINSAMPLAQALELCPHLVVVKSHYSFYEDLSEKFINSIKKYTPLVQQASIDECYADMTEAIKQFEKPLDLAWQIQQNLYHDLNLKCSIGIAPNKFLAKIASDMKKPMGITVLRKQEVKSKLWPLAVSDMQGIGKKTAPSLKKLGIETIGDLANYKEVDHLKSIFGKNTLKVIERANGHGSDEIIVSHDVKSISQSTTFLKDIGDYQEITMMFRKLANKLEGRLKEASLVVKGISISVRYHDFNTIVRSKKLTKAIQSADDIYENAIALYDQNESDITIRHIGIGLSHLQKMNDQVMQINLFEQEYSANKTIDIIEKLNKELKSDVLKPASALQKKHK